MAKTTAYVTNYFTIDFINKTICGSPASFKKASTGIGDAYDELVSKMKSHPNFELKENKSDKKKTYEGLNYELMESYIETLPNADVLRKKMDLVKDAAKRSAESVYPIVKKWFLEAVGKDFNVVEAKKAVKESKEKKILEEAQGSAELPADSKCPSEN